MDSMVAAPDSGPPGHDAPRTVRGFRWKDDIHIREIAVASVRQAAYCRLWPAASDAMPTHRRLSVILSLDVVGFTRMLRADEQGTLRAMGWIRRELGEPLLARHRGKPIKIMGDGALIEFESVHEAAVWAMEFQRAVALVDKRNAVGQPIVSRIAIVLADLIVAGEERYGEGLNFGVRLQEIAPPGGVVVSEAAWFTLRGDMRARFRDGGEFQVKNIEEPVRGYVWTPDQDPPPRTSLAPSADEPPADE